MKKSTVGILIAAVTLPVLLIGGDLLLRHGFGIDLFDRSGWSTTEAGAQYLDYYGKPLTGWQTIEDKRYYFAPDGAMGTGWQHIDGQRYYLGTDGVPKTGWQTLDGEKYYLGEDGAVQTGAFAVNDGYYYADSNGVIQTGWQETADGRLYLDAEGVRQTGWVTVDEKQYYLNEQGILQTGWLEQGEDRYYLHDDGAAATGWTDIGEHRYYFTETGTMYRGWLTLEDGRYYLKEDGVMAIGQITLEDVNHFFTSKGKYVLLVNAWNPVPQDYEPELVDVGSHQVDASCIDALNKMMDACKAELGRCYILSTYRSESVQRYIWNRRVGLYMEEGYDRATANALTGRSVMVPGHSEHQTGLAIDFSRDDPTVLKWLAQHCWDYGFILRYPAGKYDVTGIVHESWHFRYVGTELSQELKELDLCMEEYMQMLTQKETEKTNLSRCSAEAIVGADDHIGPAVQGTNSLKANANT